MLKLRLEHSGRPTDLNLPSRRVETTAKSYFICKPIKMSIYKVVIHNKWIHNYTWVYIFSQIIVMHLAHFGIEYFVLVYFEIRLIIHQSSLSVILIRVNHLHQNLSQSFYLKRSPAWCVSVDWVLAYEPKGCLFNSQSGHVPGLQPRSPVGGTQEATTHWCFSPSLSPSLLLSLKISKCNL